jgi:serine protease Do
VIGINTAIYSPNGGNVGIGFAIPAKQAETVVASLKQSGAVTRGWLGVQIQGIDEDLAKALGADDKRGALVAEVTPDSPAARGGLVAGDVIRSVDGAAIADARELSRVVAATRPGSRVEVEVLRDGRRKEVAIEIGNLEATAAVDHGVSAPGGRESLAGLTLQELTPSARAQLGLADDATGVVVESVDPESAASEKGVVPGDVITQINQRPVRSVAEARNALAAARKDSERALMVLRRGDSQRYVAVPLS